MAAQIALFTSSDLDFPTEMDFLKEQTETSCCLCLSCAYYAIDTLQDGFRKLKATIIENGGIVE